MQILWTGAGVALAAGLAFGAMLRPDLAADGRPAGPQIVGDWAAQRTTGPFDDDAVSYASYAGKVPDYVVGTDFKRLQRQPWTATTAAAPAPSAADDAPALRSADLTPAAFDAAAATDSADDLVVPDVEDEAPPEATGDTRPAS